MEREFTSSTRASVDEVADGTVAVSEFVRQFVRRHVDPGRRAQADLALQPGGTGGATSHNLSLIPLSTRFVRSQLVKSRRSNNGPTRLIRRKPAESNRTRTGVAMSNHHPQSPEVPAYLGEELHQLWLGYARTVVDWPRLALQAKDTPAANASQTNQLETVLRMSLVGARLQIVRSTAAPLAGREGIVIMETRNVFRMLMKRQSLATGQSSKDDATGTTVPLRSVPKQGTVFLLMLNSLASCSGLLFSGDQLAYRPVDRAVRKWRRPVLPMRGLGDQLPTTAEMIAELCCPSPCIAS